MIDLTPLQEELSQPDEKLEETKLEKHELTNEEVKEVSSASLPKELEGETVVKAKKIENEEPAAVDNIQKSLETVDSVESHRLMPSSSEETKQEHGAVYEKIEEEKVEEVSMVQIKSHEEVSKAVKEQTIDVEPSLTENFSKDQNQPEEQVEEAWSRDEQEKGISRNMEKEEEEAETKTDEEPRLDVTEKNELETAKTVVEYIEIVNNEEASAHESKILKRDDHQGENAELVEAIKNSGENLK
ncbi:PREDICTED: rho GTPase-activating protein gacV-like [Camelina sativa]|uniref:Rho GTPase-activating protein gacV-like n=1 Tax=Camelina sativa TaxID=90675 RepID=A0ABM0U6X3_CAMSA|nr:PREDICTED: rho GTPase-activating protein gacV-like [Camelina sativa]